MHLKKQNILFPPCIGLRWLLYVWSRAHYVFRNGYHQFLGVQELSKLSRFISFPQYVITWESLYSRGNFQCVFISTKLLLKGDKSNVKQVKVPTYSSCYLPSEEWLWEHGEVPFVEESCPAWPELYLWNSDLINLDSRYPLMSNTIFFFSPKNRLYLYFRGVNRKPCLFYSFLWFHSICPFFLTCQT